jgi:RNA polymerase sigma factor (sigma-70 family)
MNKVSYQSEEQLIVALAAGNEQALGMIYKTYFPMVLHFITQNSGTEQEAKDIYQESVIVLYENLQEKDFALTCKIKTYIYSVCRRLWLKKLAQKNKYVGKIEDFESFIPFVKDEADLEDKDEQYKAMTHAMEQLGEPCRTIMEDFFIHEFSMQQISDKMGYTNADNAKNQKYKCLLRLRKIFFGTYKGS